MTAAPPQARPVTVRAAISQAKTYPQSVWDHTPRTTLNVPLVLILILPQVEMKRLQI
jgi:hypothetical protein